ncbi:MAG: peptidylprolyl isomerase [Bryobacteraceae bacterium]
MPKLPPETVVLTIGTEKITVADMDHMIDMIPEQYRERMRTVGRRQFADNIIRLKMMVQAAHQLKLEDSEAYKSQLAFQAEQILANQYYQHLVATEKVDEATARKYYDDHQSDYLQVKAAHILVRVKGAPGAPKKDAKELTDEEALAKATEIRKKLADGGNWDEIAKADSDDSTNASKGGDLGTFGHGRMAAPFEQAAFTLPIGEISQPVKTQFGYHIIKVEKREERPFVEVRPEIERKLDAELVKKTMDDLKTNTAVVENPDYFGPPPAPPAPAAAKGGASK